jgi:hypothetical protein
MAPDDAEVAMLEAWADQFVASQDEDELQIQQHFVAQALVSS